MSYRLGILDKSPVAPGRTGAEAIATTLEYAREADRLGYHRFWLAEHHGSDSLASAAPELLIAHIAALTRRIRVGSGGVLLQHYSPFKVAELFNVLAVLAPGRIDLGIGKSPGGLPAATRALQAELASGSAAQIGRKLRELDGWLRAPEGVDLQPRPAILPETFLLGGSPRSAAEAAGLNWGFVHAGHQDGDRANTVETFARYHAISGRNPLLAVQAFAAPSRGEAEERVADLRFFRLILPDGHAVNLQSEAAAIEYARQYGAQSTGSGAYTVEEKRPTVIAGTGAEVHEALSALQRDLNVAEFIIDQPVADHDARLRSLDLIAQGARKAAA